MTREELNAEATKMGIKNPESYNTKADLEVAIRDHLGAPTAPEEPAEVPVDEPVEMVEAPAPAPANEGSEIASAIVEGMKNAGKGRPIKISADKSVQSMFSVVRSKRTGEVMLRENSSGTLSKVQLQSLEEKEASIQNEEVEIV